MRVLSSIIPSKYSFLPPAEVFRISGILIRLGPASLVASSAEDWCPKLDGKVENKRLLEPTS